VLVFITIIEKKNDREFVPNHRASPFNGMCLDFGPMARVFGKEGNISESNQSDRVLSMSQSRRPEVTPKEKASTIKTTRNKHQSAKIMSPWGFLNDIAPQ
jgi:hypothetical protein